jgi:hypothetical protein
MAGQPVAMDKRARFLELTSVEKAEGTLDEMKQRITDGETLLQVSQALNVPHGLFASWIEDEPTRMEMYKAALRVRADGLLHAALTTAANTQAGQTVKEGPDGTVITTEDMLGHRKLIVDTNLKVAARWDPARFGDSQRVELTAKVIKPNEITLLEGARRIAFMMARGAQLAEQKRREPRLLEGTASTVPQAAEEEDHGI